MSAKKRNHEKRRPVPSPSELAKTEAEPVPPPEANPRTVATHKGQRPPSPNPDELVKTEGERVPPPAHR